MAHELTPRAGQQYLSPEGIVQRLRMAFKYVDASEGRGAESIEEGIQYMRRSGAFSDEEIARLPNIKDRAIEVTIADELAHGLAYLVVVIEPDEPLFFSYESRSHEEAAKPLLERIATVLDYNLELV